MLAIAWPWDDSLPAYPNELGRRLSASLCAGIGGHAGFAELDGIHFSYRPRQSSAITARSWRPARLANGSIVVFHGYFDNAAEIAAALGAVPGEESPRLYGLAVERWGDEADRKIIGEYCAVVSDPKRKQLRLSRSPLRAPPLCYFHDDRLGIVASVPRAIFAAGVEQRLNYNHVADSALLNFTDPEASWFEDVFRVPNGAIVELKPGRGRVLRRFYNLLDVPSVQMASDADYIARAGELLDEGVKACLAGFRRPGATLSGGLDSPQVAARVLKALPDARLPTFTFHPEDGYDGIVEGWMFGDERPFVKAFAAMHPRIDPHFTANEGYEHDHRWNDFFHLMGGAPSGLCNMYVFHGLFEGAARDGCDLLLVSDWGNYAFSEAGHWGYVEYLLSGRLRQLWLALSAIVGDNRNLAWRFVAKSILPLLPEPLWRLARRIVFPGRGALLDKIQPLNWDYRLASGGQQRLKDSGLLLERAESRSRGHALKLHVERGDFEVDEGYQAFEQMYGIAQRDPMAYRPFVEFCLGLPTKMFLRDGQTRWLAREMAKGIMPKQQRLNPRSGRWDADWHLRIGRRRAEFLDEFDRLARDERMSAMLDLPRLRAALEEWPEQTVTDRFQSLSREMAVPRGLLTARFVNYVEGRNRP